jgi:hypothetical protein
MLNQIPQFFLILIAQGSGAGPPVPKSGPPGLPPEVPLDSSIWILGLAAIAIAAYYFYISSKASKLSN